MKQIITSILKWFKKQQLLVKILIIVIIIIAIFAATMTVKYSISEYRRLKIAEKERNEYQKQIQEKDIIIDSLINVGYKRLITIKKKSTTIDKKLIEDEKTINDTDITDADIAGFIAKHKK